MLGYALAFGVVIAGLQWATLTQTRAPGVLAVVLGLPALLAGVTVARLFTVRELRHQPGGRSRSGVRR